ncbi:MAG: S8 family serine peptidase [Gammaproteobacteria bacterium]|nr:S8 family serine peptidase [Gammaproteobacteria bacterium]
MNSSFKMFVKHFCTLYMVITIFSTSLFAQQGYIKGKMIKRGLWKNHSLEYVADELCVFIKQGKTKQEVLTLFNKFKGQLSREIDERGFTVVTFPDSTDVISIAEQLNKNSAIKAIEPNTVCRALLIPNDTYFQSGKQWALYNYGQDPPDGTIDADIDMMKAWDITQASSADILAVLDSGIPIVNGNLSHGDLDDANRFILGNDYSGENDNSVKDEYGHGTHVLGIIGAETNNSQGIAGIIYDGTFLIIQAFDGYGYGTEEGFYDAVKYAVDYGAKVINFSGGFGYYPSTTLESAVSYADDNDAIIVASTGNDSHDYNMYPAAYSDSYDNVISVSATDHNDYYAVAYANASASTNVFAPGGYGGTFNADDIYSCTPNYSFYLDYLTDTTYGYMAGTSMATAHVSGVAALVLSINSSLSPLQVRTIIETTANNVHEIELPRLNAYEALKYTIENYGGSIGSSGKTVTFHEDITINSGVTLTILPGTTVNFDAGKKLTVNGKLVANGTSANRITFKAISGAWNGIKFFNADNASSLDYCKIQNTTRAIHIDNSDVTIESNEIDNCSDYGIYIYNAEPTICNNYIHDADSYAIAANNAGNTFIRKNSIIDCYGGVAVWGSSTIKMRGKSGSSYGLNKIDNWGSGYGVYILGGTPDLGQYSPSSQRGYNDILRDTQYAVYKANSGEVDAEKNYWGGTPQSSWFYGDVNYDFPLSSSQGAGSDLEKSAGMEPDKDLLVKGNDLADAGKFQEASDVYKSLIDQYPDSRHAGKALAWAMAAENSLDALESQRDYLRKMTQHENPDVRGKALLWLQTLEAHAGNRKTSEDIVNGVPIDDVIGWEIRLNWANDLLNLYGDSLSAENDFNELQNVYSDVATSEVIQMIRGTARSPEEAALPKPMARYSSTVLPSDFSMSQNYPNPFNPSTSIRFTLPKAGKVKMTIFDIRGREIATLVDMEMAVGTHIVAWDGKNASGINVSSGIYFYRIKFNNQILTGKMILVR